MQVQTLRKEHGHERGFYLYQFSLYYGSYHEEQVQSSFQLNNVRDEQLIHA